MAEVAETVMAIVLQLAQRKSPARTTVAREERLIGDLGLDSLDIAELVATLEVELGDDPFATRASIADVRSVGDLVDAYATR